MKLLSLVRGQRSGRFSGFTLIELLVVISIIALLISILLPSLGQARETARMASCLSNVGNITKSVFMYQADTDGYYPKVWYQNAAVAGGWTHYTEQLSPYLNIIARQPGDANNYLASVRGAEGAARVLRCPDQYGSTGNLTSTDALYAVNPNLMPYVNVNNATKVETTQATKFDLRFPNKQIRESMVTETSKNVMVTDSKGRTEPASNDFNARDWGYTLSPHYASVTYNYSLAYEYWVTGDKGVGTRGFADGHVATNGLKDMRGEWEIGDRPLGYLSWYID